EYTWIPPSPSITSVSVSMCGGGGSGGGGGAGTFDWHPFGSNGETGNINSGWRSGGGGGGGGSAGECSTHAIPVNNSSSIKLRVGAGGIRTRGGMYAMSVSHWATPGADNSGFKHSASNGSNGYPTTVQVFEGTTLVA